MVSSLSTFAQKDTIFITRVDTVYITKTDTVYVDKSQMPQAIGLRTRPLRMSLHDEELEFRCIHSAADRSSSHPAPAGSSPG